MCKLRYVSNGLLNLDRMKAIIDTIREMRGRNLYMNEVDSDAEGANPERERASRRLSPAELVTELARRESLMKRGVTGVTDQWRVYTHIIEAITSGTPLRLLVQASAGTGKSFLLTTVYLWRIVNGKKAKACAPTGIAAANVEIEGTDVAATTIHAMLDMDTDLKTKLDFAKVGHNKVAALLALEVLFIDEARDAMPTIKYQPASSAPPTVACKTSPGHLHACTGVVIAVSYFQADTDATLQPRIFLRAMIAKGRMRQLSLR